MGTRGAGVQGCRGVGTRGQGESTNVAIANYAQRVAGRTRPWSNCELFRLLAFDFILTSSYN